jgi:hypothetical protein
MAVPLMLYALCKGLNRESPLIALDKLISSGFDLPPVVMGSILKKCKKSKSCSGPAWSIGNWETIALAYADELDS